MICGCGFLTGQWTALISDDVKRIVNTIRKPNDTKAAHLDVFLTFARYRSQGPNNWEQVETQLGQKQNGTNIVPKYLIFDFLTIGNEIKPQVSYDFAQRVVPNLYWAVRFGLHCFL